MLQLLFESYWAKLHGALGPAELPVVGNLKDSPFLFSALYDFHFSGKNSCFTTSVQPVRMPVKCTVHNRMHRRASFYTQCNSCHLTHTQSGQSQGPRKEPFLYCYDSLMISIRSRILCHPVITPYPGYGRGTAHWPPAT